MEHRTTQEFITACFIPFWGVIRGLMKAFEPEASQRRLAGVNFAGALSGALAWWACYSYVVPLATCGLGGPAYNRGVEAYQKGEWGIAETAFRDAVAADPCFGAAWVNLSYVQLKQEDAGSAEQSARRAVSLLESGNYGAIPGSELPSQIKAMAYGNLAAALALQLQVQPAAEAAQRALEIDPASSSASSWRQLTEIARDAAPF